MSFFFVLVFSSLDYVLTSWSIGEASRDAEASFSIYIIKTTIPITALILFLQGLSLSYFSIFKLKMIESVLLFFSVILLLMAGFPVAFTLGCRSYLLPYLLTGNFDPGYLNALPSRIFGTMTNETLWLSLFYFHGYHLEK